MLIPEIKSWYKNIGVVCGQKWLWPSWSQGKWMSEWMNWADFSCWRKFKKVKNYRKSINNFSGAGQKWALDSNFNEWINVADFLHANTYLRKLRVSCTLVVSLHCSYFLGGGEGGEFCWFSLNNSKNPSWFSLNNSKTVKAITLEFCSIQ